MNHFIIYTNATQIEIAVSDDVSPLLSENLDAAMLGRIPPNTLMAFDALNMKIRADCVMGYRFFAVEQRTNRKTKVIQPK